MRFLIILVMLAVAAVVVVLLLYAFGGLSADGRRRREPSARWEARTESSDGVTTVLVRQVTRDASGAVLAELGRQTVAAIPDGDADWETRYHEAMAQARSRVAALEVESG
ncbi:MULTISPECIES: hypothetical protein [Actinomadura]|uniref:Uncharacterized protein n=1 Tax=Actinomadura litoris TaxID=2678616 RepID=A0A7K1L7J5_9ACTN|nr:MULTISPECIES: hypothetical protein [Actinomadura]MBT2210607.1 hypothetical protein [Actinomadura sp. NEAU-AAG7]MUN40400.1 hypothetical protein [Actinomadura litoris]